jgi:putative membrane protein
LIVQFFQGIAIGIALILPGLSAGTVILILGFYKQFIDDLSSFRLKPYLPHLCGAAAGALAGVKVVGLLLVSHRDLLLAFLLGMVIASVRVILFRNGRVMRLRPWTLILGPAAFAVAWFIFGNPAPGWTALPAGSHQHFFIAGALAAATMILPGISGSSTLVMMNLYDDMIVAVNHWEWLKLAVFSTGGLLGIFVLARLLAALYRRYHDAVSLTLAGLILGATRSLLPSTFSSGVLLTALAGGAMVLLLGSPFLGRLRGKFNDLPDRSPPVE